jgi:5'-nucleotidase
LLALAFVATMGFRKKVWYRARVATPALAAIAMVAAVWALSGCAARLAEAPLTLKLIALNDFHGQLRPPGGGTRVADTVAPQGASLSLPTGGVAWLATLVDQLRAQSPLNAVVAAGDLIGASPLESALFHDEPAIEALNAVGLEFSAVGNHEFDEGSAELQRMQNGGCHSGPAQESCRRGRFEGARFRYLAANVLDATTGATVFPASGLKTFDLGRGRRLKVGFIGAVVKGTPGLVVAGGVRNLTFTDEASAVNAAVPGLRKQGAQVIVLLIHEGGYSTASAFDDDTCPGFSGDIVPIVDRLDPAISVVVSGHTHRAYICRRNGRLLTSAGSQGRYVTDIDVSVEPRSGRVVGTSARQVAVVNDLAPNPLPERYPTVAKNEQVDSIVSYYVAASAPFTERVVAAIASDITRELSPAGESALGDLIADAQLAATSANENGGAQLALMNRAGIRTDLLARRGSVTFGDIHAIHPFGNALVTITLTGAQLHAVLEQQWPSGSVLQISEGFTYEWSSDAPPGSKVDPRSMRLNGAALEPDKRYRVTVNEFLAGGGDGFQTLTEGADLRRGIQDVEALERYLAAHSPIVAPRIGRIRRR